MNFHHKTIVITGASAGIGRGLAIALAHQSADLVLAARNQTALMQTVQLCRDAGAQAIGVVTDVTVPEQCQKLMAKALEEFGQLDILVNNAGISMIAPFDSITNLSAVEQVMRVNYLGAVYCTHYALPALKQNQGLLVAISSLCGKTGVPMRTAYVASKHALQGFFDTLRIELLASGIDVCVISPGYVATNIRQQALDPEGNPQGRSPRDETSGTMSIDDCVQKILWGMAQRRRDVLMTPKGKLLPWMKLIAPTLVDRIAAAASPHPNSH